ncbi:hypothetical protein D3C81_2309290 [compost metagenome]
MPLFGAELRQFLGFLPKLFAQGALFASQPTLPLIEQRALVLSDLRRLGDHFF